MCGIVFEKIGDLINGVGIIDAHNFYSGIEIVCTKNDSSNTAETIDSDAKHGDGS